MDTHAICQELGGNGKGLVKVFLHENKQVAVENLCAWVWKRLSQSGVKSCAQQSQWIEEEVQVIALKNQLL